MVLRPRECLDNLSLSSGVGCFGSCVVAYSKYHTNVYFLEGNTLNILNKFPPAAGPFYQNTGLDGGAKIKRRHRYGTVLHTLN